MFDQHELRRAIQLQQKSYKLLKWLKTAVNRNAVPVERAHDALDSGSAARYWIEVSLPGLPPGARPKADELDQVANLFASYLTTSFELTKSPGRVKASDCGCYCPTCTYVTRAPYLKVRKTTAHDKRKAKELMADMVKELAWAQAQEVSGSEAANLAGDRTLRRDLALVTYARHLIRRMAGSEGSPALLVLWRAIAWKERGGLDPDFELTPEAVLLAEHRVRDRLRDA